MSGGVTARGHGGPLDGVEFTSRYPKGVVVVNRRARQVVIYDWNGITLAARNNGRPELELTAGPKNRYRAALEPNYDVVAYDPERMGPWPR